MQARRDDAMNAGVLAAHQRNDLADGILFDAQIEIELLAVPAPLRFHTPEAARRTVGARRFSSEAYFPLPRFAGRGRDVQVRIRHVEDGFGIAEFEIQPPQNVYRRESRQEVPVHERFEIPAAPLGLGQVDAGVFQLYGREFEPY